MSLGEGTIQANNISISNGTTTTITRSVPRRCEVCKGKSKRMPTCEVCDGKGWLYVYETEVTTSGWVTPSPNVQPYPQPYPYPNTQPITPFYSSGQNDTAKGLPFMGIAINCASLSHG